MKNITLSANEQVIEEARKNIAASGKTLNGEFREWLASKATTPKQKAMHYRQLMQRLSYINAGRKFTREEMNER